MKKGFYIFLLLMFTFVSYAEDAEKVRFAYDVDFEMRFDNREFYRSNFSPSMTIFGARLTPVVGVDIKDRSGSAHKLMAGIDVMKDFGAADVNSELFRELTMYYNLRKKVSKTEMEIYAGIFPRKLLGGAGWSQAFFSDSLKFYDNNLEGLLLKFHRPEAYFEVGCDWMGQYGVARREKFMVFTSGCGKILPFMSLGYSGYMLHYANSTQAKGLVDNFLLDAYADFDFSGMSGLQNLSFKLGWLQAAQRDREYVGRFVTPYGVEFDQHVRNWNVGIYNRMFFGHDMMPYYNTVDNAGVKYGSNLYFGDLFYRVHDNGRTGAGLYDRLEAYYEPSLGKYMTLRVSAVFHFNDFNYSGCQQVVSLRFNLHELGIMKDYEKK